MLYLQSKKILSLVIFFPSFISLHHFFMQPKWWSSIEKCRKKRQSSLGSDLAKSGYKPHMKYKSLNQPPIYMATHWKLNIKIWEILLYFFSALLSIQIFQGTSFSILGLCAVTHYHWQSIDNKKMSWFYKNKVSFEWFNIEWICIMQFELNTNWLNLILILNS